MKKIPCIFPVASVLLLSLVTTVVMVENLSAAGIAHGLCDEQGRHVVPRGFVVNTNDGIGPIEFSPDDYHRMVLMGANYQVVRLELGRLSTFPGCSLEQSYLEKLDRLVRLGREAGLKTVFKMTVYGVKGFSWESFWANEDDIRQTYLEAWIPIWERYQDDSSVVGYDLVNEPRKKTMEISYSDLTTQYLIPYYETLIDAAAKISENKLFLCQSIFMNKGEAIEHNQYAEMPAPIKRKNVVFAPHIYQDKMDYILPTMQRFEKESKMMNAPILIGEWGFPTYESADSSTKEQLEFIEFYVRTAEIFDQMGVGSIKAWFLGTRTMQDFLPRGRSTWAIFSDEHAIGTVERKYITDIIARPYPQVIAGDIQSFLFHHATRTLDLSISPDNSKGASRIFVGANRHYPDGFSVIVGEDLILTHNPLHSKGLEVVTARETSQPNDFIWDESRQQLVVLKWPEVEKDELNIKIVPGVRADG